MSRPSSSSLTPGVFIFSDRSLVFIDDVARQQTGCPADASLPECERTVAPILDAVRAHPSNTATVNLPASRQADGTNTSGPRGIVETDEEVTRKVRASADVSNGMHVVRVWPESDAQRAQRLKADEAFRHAVRPVYRAFAHDARNPIVASQLQLGILRELDAEMLEDRSRSIADTLERHMESMSDGISLLIDELAPESDTAPADVLVVVDQVRQLVLPYAKRKSVAVEARTDAAEIYTSASAHRLKRAVLGYLARILGDASTGDRIDLHVDLSASTGAPELTITAAEVTSTSERARSAAKALRFDVDQLNARVRIDALDGGTRVRLTLPPARA